MRQVPDRDAEVALVEARRDEFGRRQGPVWVDRRDRSASSHGLRPRPHRTPTGLDASSGLMISTVSGSFAFGGRQPSADDVQPASLRPVAAIIGIEAKGGVCRSHRTAARSAGSDPTPRAAAEPKTSSMIADRSIASRRAVRTARVGELGMIRPQIEQDGRQRRTRVSQQPAPGGRRETRGHLWREARRPRRTRRVGTRRRARRRCRRSVKSMRARYGTGRAGPRRGRAASWPGRSVGVIGSCAGATTARGRDQLGAIVVERTDGERSGPDRMTAERVGRELARRERPRGDGRARSAGSRPEGSRRAASSSVNTTVYGPSAATVTSFHDPAAGPV